MLIYYLVYQFDSLLKPKTVYQKQDGISEVGFDNLEYALNARILNIFLDNPSLAAAFKLKPGWRRKCMLWCNHRGCTIDGKRCYPYLKQAGDILIDHFL